MVYIYLPAVYYHFNLDGKESLLAGGVFRCPSGLSCYYSNCVTYCVIITVSSNTSFSFNDLRVVKSITFIDIPGT